MPRKRGLNRRQASPLLMFVTGRIENSLLASIQRMILSSLLIVAVLMNLTKSASSRISPTEEIYVEIPYIAATWDSHEYYEDSSQNEQTGIPRKEHSYSSNVRRKKISSLSITNPMDVLRQRFILELARRRQMQQQEQAKANREILNDIGKRSTGYFGLVCPSIKTKNRQVLREPINQMYSNNPDWSHRDRVDWYYTEHFKELNTGFYQLNEVSFDSIILSFTNCYD
ncbi:diuretic hormone 44 isoform X1 [Diachasma alloeum]|uniref:diuretic hormone 44 isoform X1 n=1 Tax=Diachasma alloeum TaxID=454923 RepID=UPI000738357A|nr:diuretic hormone 44 isoform X1 [Diachasma alloeum]